jgi:hypothetical protein
MRRFQDDSRDLLWTFAKVRRGRLLLALVAMMISSGLLSAAEPGDAKPATQNGLLLKAAAKMREAEEDLGNSPNLAKRIRLLSWSLIRGRNRQWSRWPRALYVGQ